MSTPAETDKLLRAAARIRALRQNLLARDIPETYVQDYHDALRHLEDLGMDVDEFKIPDSHLRNLLRSSNYLTGEKTYSKDRYVPGAFMLAKLDAVLGYIDLLTQERPRGMGFKQ